MFAAITMGFAAVWAPEMLWRVDMGGFRLILGGSAVLFVILAWDRRRRVTLQTQRLDARAGSDCAYPMTDLPGRPAGEQLAS